MIDVKACLNEAEEMMQMSIMHLEDEYSHIRAGKANVHLLDCVRVHSYGSEMPINNVATVTTPDLRTIAIKPWDKNMIAPIEKAIIDSPVGIMPTNNGEVIIIAIPPLTGERRKDLVKQCSHELETAKISIRNARRDGIDTLKKSVRTVHLRTWQRTARRACRRSTTSTSRRQRRSLQPRRRKS